MPLISGWDLVNELALHENPGPVFMLTSSIFKADEEKAKEFSFIRDYFIKPLNASMIERMKQWTSNEIQITDRIPPAA